MFSALESLEILSSNLQAHIDTLNSFERHQPLLEEIYGAKRQKQSDTLQLLCCSISAIGAFMTRVCQQQIKLTGIEYLFFSNAQ